MKKIYFLIIFFLSSNLFAQSEQDQFNKQIEEILKARAEMLKSLFDDSSSGEMEKRMEEMMKRFGHDFGGMGSPFTQMNSQIIGEYDWVVTDTHKILKLKVTQVKDHPLDIKIEKGMIKVKGNVEAISGTGKNKTKSKVSFERSFSLPNDIDQTNPEFENKDGELLVKFKKLAGTKKMIKPKVQDDRVPVAPTGDDLSI